MEQKRHLRKVVGSNVKGYRFKIGFTQEELAERCNLSSRYISDIENSNGNIPLDTIEDLAKVLKVSPHLLLRERPLKPLPMRINEGRKPKRRKRRLKADNQDV